MSAQIHLFKQPVLWSHYQKAIFENAKTGQGHTAILARAGSGKTTVLLEALKHVPKGKTILMVAFNKSIAEELARKAPSNVDVRTLHSLGYRTVRQAFGEAFRGFDEGKGYRLAASVYGSDKPVVVSRLAKVVSLCKSQLAETLEDIEDVVEEHRLVFFGMGRTEGLRLVQRILQAAKGQSATVDFDDQIWLPWALGLVGEKFDRVFVDEVQDMNAAQLHLALSACKPDGRICVAGDPSQAVYKFRGAASDSFSRVVAGLGATILPLSICYRCDSKILDEARTIVPDIENSPYAKSGEVRTISKASLFHLVREGDFILSRTNAPLVPLCRSLWRLGRSANIKGKECGAQLLQLLKQAKQFDVQGLVGWLHNWKTIEVERLSRRGKDAQSIVDLVDSLLYFCEEADTIEFIEHTIRKVFVEADSDQKVILSTTHKAKGLERNRVFVIRNTYLKSRGKSDQGVTTEEENLFYVAVTRAKHELYFVQDEASP